MAAPRATLILLLGLACAGSILAQESTPTVRHHRVPVEDGSAALARAEAAIDGKDYAAAEQALTQAIKLYPNDYRAWFDLGFVYTALNRDGDAIAAYRKSVAADSTVFESNLNLGLMLARTHDPDAARYLRAATQLKPTAKPEEGLYRAWISLGQVLESTDPKQALAALRRASQLRPSLAEPHLLAAAAAENSQDFATAEQEYQAVVALDPKSLEAVIRLANIYTQTQRLPEAESALRRLLALDPENARAHLQLGRVLAAQKKNQDAQAEFERALRFAPSDAAADRELALLYVDNKQFAKAEPFLRAALQKDPRDAELHHRLASVLIEQQKFQEAQNESLLAVNLKPDFGIAYGALAFAASENKNYPLALKALDARARLLPEIPSTLFLRATVYDHLGARQEAANAYHQFLAVAGGHFPDQEWQARHRLIALERKK